LLCEERVDIAEAVGLATQMTEDMARRGQIEVSTDIDAKVPLILGDLAKLRQILLNLLSNAIKFTPQGGEVALQVQCLAQGGIELVVRDTGIGMSPDQIPIAMEAFGQIDTGLARKYDGAGLGLPLTKRLVELHGGTLTIESHLGKGTAVSVHLPEERLATGPRLAGARAGHAA